MEVFTVCEAEISCSEVELNLDKAAEVNEGPNDEFEGRCGPDDEKEGVLGVFGSSGGER